MANTSLIGLTLPTQGTLSGTWGDTVNNAISQIVDVAVAGTQTLTTDADVDLTLTTGSASSTGLTSTSSQYAVLLCTGARTAARYINTPKQSKTYVVINDTTGGYAVTVRGGPTSPTTGVTVAAGTRAIIAWNGSDFVNVGGGSAGGSTTQVQYNSSGSFAGSANFTFDGTNVGIGVSPTASKGQLQIGTIGYTGSNILAAMASSVNGYNQVVSQNTNAGTAASSDFIVSNNNSTDSTYYGDFGMNSSGWTGTGPFDSPNNVYMTATTADIAIGTTTTNSVLVATNATERLRVTSAGAWGLGGANYGTSGYVLTSNGAGAAPTWAAAAGGISQAKSTMISMIFGL